MKNNKILSILLILSLIFSLLITGCSNSKNITNNNKDKTTTTINSTDNSTEATNNTNKTPDIEKANDSTPPKLETGSTSPVSEKTSMESLNEILQNDKTVSEIVWSNDKSAVAYFKTIESDQKGLFMRTLEYADEEIDFKLNADYYYDIAWSPNDKYITVDKRPSDIYETSIICCESWEVIDEISNGGGPVWSPDSSMIAFARLNDKTPVILLNLEGTFDIALYDIETKQIETLLEGENDFSYFPTSWDEVNLYYTKSYLGSGESEEGMYSFTSPSDLLNEYEIITESEESDDSAVKISIKYPKLINLPDTKVENIINETINNKIDMFINEIIPHTGDDFPKNTITIDYKITKQSEELLSIRFNYSHFIEGNDYPNDIVSGLTFNLKTGEEYEYLGELFKNDSDFLPALNEELEAEVDMLGFQILKSYEGLTEKEISAAVNFFNISDEYLIIYHPVGEYTSHDFGPLDLEVRLETISDYLKSIFIH